MEKNDLTDCSVVEVVYSPAERQVVCKEVDLSAVAGEGKSESLTVRDVLLASGMLECFPELSLDTVNMGIWGKRVTQETMVSPDDRIEIYRDLIVDPKEARRLRHEKQGSSGPRYRPGYRGKV